jgi:hypothetical protein
MLQMGSTSDCYSGTVTSPPATSYGHRMKKISPEQALAELRASAELHRGLVKPHPLRLEPPEGAIDVTGEQAGKTFAIVGATAVRPLKVKHYP